MRAALVAFVFVPCACSNDLGDLIAEHAQDSGVMAGAEPAAKEPPWLPVLPDEENVAACTACAKEKCVQARTNCLLDDACMAVLRCKGEADDPARLQACEAEHGFSAWYEDLWDCVMAEACAAECRSGENWGCVDEYAWPVAEDSRFRVRYTFAPVPFTSRERPVVGAVGGATVRACDAIPCLASNRLDTGLVDARNGIELEVASDASGAFRGALEIESAGFDLHRIAERLWPPPVAQPGELRLESGSGAVVVELLEPAVHDGGADLQDAPLMVTLYDCTRIVARQVRVELPAVADAEPLYFATATLSLSADVSPWGVALIPAVPAPARERALVVRGVRTDSGAIVAERADIVVSPGFFTQVFVGPRAR